MHEFEIQDNQYTKNDPVPSEDFEVVLTDIREDELKYEDRYQERRYKSNTEDDEIRISYGTIILQDLQDACTEHNRYREEESKLSSHFPAYADYERSYDRCA